MFDWEVGNLKKYFWEQINSIKNLVMLILWWWWFLSLMMMIYIILLLFLSSRILACSNNGDTWIKHSSSGDCYECSCEGSTVRCSSAIFCATGCPWITVPVPGKCCPKCEPSEYQSATILHANESVARLWIKEIASVQISIRKPKTRNVRQTGQIWFKSLTTLEFFNLHRAKEVNRWKRVFQFANGVVRSYLGQIRADLESVAYIIWYNVRAHDVFAIMRQINIISINLFKYYHSVWDSTQQPHPYSRSCRPRQWQLHTSPFHSRGTWYHLMTIWRKATRSNKNQVTIEQRRLADHTVKKTTIYFAFVAVFFKAL